MTLMTAAMSDVTTPASAPARRECDRLAAQKPAQSRIAALTTVDVVDLTSKSVVGTNQSRAVRARNEPLKSAAHTRVSRHANPVTCVSVTHPPEVVRSRKGYVLGPGQPQRIGSALKITPASLLTYANPQGSVLSMIMNQSPCVVTSSVSRQSGKMSVPGSSEMRFTVSLVDSRIRAANGELERSSCRRNCPLAPPG